MWYLGSWIQSMALTKKAICCCYITKNTFATLSFKARIWRFAKKKRTKLYFNNLPILGLLPVVDKYVCGCCGFLFLIGLQNGSIKLLFKIIDFRQFLNSFEPFRHFAIRIDRVMAQKVECF